MTTTTYTTVNGQILCQAKDGVVHHFVSDPLGSVVMIRDNSGNTVYEAEYDPYGNVQSETGTNPSEFGYVGTLGYVKDSAFSLYVRARYLLTNLGRWLTKDPLWPDEPGYVYAGSSPSMGVDSSGLLPSPWNYHGKYCGQSIGIAWVGGRGGELGFFDKPNSKQGQTCMNQWPEPIDCLDRACLTHDLCLSTVPNYDQGKDARKCHCDALMSAYDCLLAGSDTPPITLAIFIDAFWILCLGTGIRPGPGYIGYPGKERYCRICHQQAKKACRHSPNPKICFERYRRMYCKKISPTC